MSCGRKIGPFDCCSVVQGDCLELMKQLPDGCVDAVITDPPYGIGYVARKLGDNEYRTGRTLYEGVGVVGDDRPFDPTPLMRIAPKLVLWGANNYADKLPSSSAWWTWDKRGDPRFYGNNTFSDCEMAWTNIGNRALMYRQIWNGIVREGEDYARAGFGRVHPTQKPTELMRWCLQTSGTPLVTLDPYAGSGTLGVAAAQLGLHYLLFEISPDYCEIARKRIALVEAQPNLFEPKAEQLTLAPQR